MLKFLSEQESKIILSFDSEHSNMQSNLQSNYEKFSQHWAHVC